MFSSPATILLCALNEKQGGENFCQKDFQIMRKLNLVPLRIIVSNGSRLGQSLSRLGDEIGCACVLMCPPMQWLRAHAQ